MSATVSTLVRPFSSIGIGDVETVGGKNASLGELFQQLAPVGVPVPDGFAITADAYRYLNVRGEKQLLAACQRCFASLFTDRAIHYRTARGFDHFGVGLSVGVQHMVRSDLAASGTMFTLDTESGFRDVVLINASYGLGENVVQGTVVPDEFSVFKPTFRAGHRCVLRRSLGTKKLTMVFAEDASGHTALGARFRPPGTSTPPQSTANRFAITDEEVLTLAHYAMVIEEHYSARAGHPTPMDIEWAKDGLDGRLYVVQARPETVASQRPTNLIERHRLTGRGPVLATGRAVGSRVGTGMARVITSHEAIGEFLPGEVLIAETTTPDWEPIMKRAAAIVTNQGGRTCHAAIVARKLPAQRRRRAGPHGVHHRR